jgi:RNA polymerase sigma factor (sigma-70 family)
MRDDPTVVALVERARDGDQAAWNQIVDRYATLIWAICRQHGLAGADAEDVAATVWLRLVERLATIREPAALPGWLASTARRACLQALRARGRQVPVEAERMPDQADHAATDEWLLREERHLALRGAFAELPEHCQKLLAMLFRDEDEADRYNRIVAALGMKKGGIGPTRGRCLDKLRENPAIAALMDTTAAGGR